MFTFLSEVKNELAKVVWPTRSETIKYTVTVIIFSVAIAAILGAFDLGLTRIMAALIAK